MLLELGSISRTEVRRGGQVRREMQTEVEITGRGLMDMGLDGCLVLSL